MSAEDATDTTAVRDLLHASFSVLQSDVIVDNNLAVGYLPHVPVWASSPLQHEATLNVGVFLSRRATHPLAAPSTS